MGSIDCIAPAWSDAVFLHINDPDEYSSGFSHPSSLRKSILPVRAEFFLAFPEFHLHFFQGRDIVNNAP